MPDELEKLQVELVNPNTGTTARREADVLGKLTLLLLFPLNPKDTARSTVRKMRKNNIYDKGVGKRGAGDGQAWWMNDLESKILGHGLKFWVDLRGAGSWT